MFDIFSTLRALDTSLVYIIMITRTVLFAVAFVWFVSAILNLYQSSTGNQGSRFLPSNAQPTVLGSIIQMFVAGLLAVTVSNFTPIAVIGALFNDNMQAIQLYTVQSYAGTPNNDQFQELLRRLIKQAFYLMGFIAIFRGLSALYQKNQGTSNEQTGRIFTWLILGTLCFFIEWVNAVFESMFNFDVFKVIFGG